MALIMVADDAPDIVELLKDIIERRGYQVVSVADGVQMVEKAKTWKPHVIIADIMMPGAYGSAAYKALQQDPVTASIPVIFLTAVGPDQARRVVPETPNTRLLHKPVDPAVLIQMIQDLLPPAKPA